MPGTLVRQPRGVCVTKKAFTTEQLLTETGQLLANQVGFFLFFFLK